jgi:hypothetical protein
MATDGDYGHISFTIKSPSTSVRLLMDYVPKVATSLTLVKLKWCVIVISIQALFNELN